MDTGHSRDPAIYEIADAARPLPRIRTHDGVRRRQLCWCAAETMRARRLAALGLVVSPRVRIASPTGGVQR